MRKINWIVKNLLIAIGIILAMILVAFVGLRVVTHHGQEIDVPDFTNLTVNEASELALANDMHIEVVDSVFVRRMEHGAVYRQNPDAGSKVKKGRRISLIINAVNSKKVFVPNLVGYSMRQAKAELEAKGLVLRRIKYVDDIATNNVLKQLYRGEEVAPGTPLESGDSIDLVVGLSSNDCHTCVPDVIGLRNINAVDMIQSNSLNVGRLVFDKTVKNYADSLSAVVYRQSPAASIDPRRMGSDVTIYLTVDKNKVPNTK